MIPSKEVKEKIEERYRLYTNSSPDKFIRQNKDVKKYLEALIKEDSWFHNVHEAFYMVARGIYSRAKCVVCGGDLTIKKVKNNIFTCSRVCAGKNPIRLEKVKKTTMERYGVDNAAKSKAIQDKMKATNLQRYGVENVFQSEQKKEKIKKTNLKKYGVAYSLQNEEIKEKAKKTNLKKYGVEYILQNEEIKEKVKKTLLQRYGVQHPAQCPEIMNKMKKTCLERYGTEYVFSVPEIFEKRKKTWYEKYGGNPLTDSNVIEKRYKTCIEKYGSKCYVNSLDYMSKEYDKLLKRFEGKIIPLFTKEEYHGINCKEIYKWKCVKCGNEFESNIYITSIDENQPLLPRCLKCYPFLTGESKSELEVLEFIKSIYNGHIIHGDRTIIKATNEFESSKELDIYLPQKKIAIEFDGFYWHSEEALKNRKLQGNKIKNYHLNKTEICEQKGIHLIHVFEDQWKNKQEIVKDRIKSILGIDRKRVFARKCIIKEISFNESNEFLNINHLQGQDNSKYRYGLFYNNELISVMTFGQPRFNNNYDYELIRFASKIGYQVIGGASKLLKYFRNKYNGSIISYADRRYSNGKLYEALGFKLIGKSQPNYVYLKNNIKLNRYQCQKHKLKDVLGENFNPELSEYENMTFNGFSRVYDCGNLVYVLN